MITFDELEERVATRERVVVIALVVAATAHAWGNRFIQDYAFISLRYARNLSEGLGLLWNEGERVEGYTDFSGRC